MDLDEDAEVKIPEPQAQPGEKAAGSQRQEEPAPAPSQKCPVMPLRPLSGVLGPEYGGGRRQQVQGEEGTVWYKVRGGETEASGDLEVSVVGQEGCTEPHRLPCVSGWGRGGGTAGHGTSQRFKPEAPGSGRALSARSSRQLPPRGIQGHRCGHLSFSPSRKSVQERLGSGSPGGPGESAQQWGQRGVWGHGEGACTS